MSGFVSKKAEHLQEALLFCFYLKKSAAEGLRLLEAYGEHALSETTCRDWFKRFKDNNFDVNDKECLGQPKKFQDRELETLLEEDSSDAQRVVGNMSMSQSLVKRLKAMGMIQKLGNWVPHELRERERHCETFNHL